MSERTRDPLWPHHERTTSSHARYRCKNPHCQRCFSDAPQRGHTEEFKEQVLAAYQERASLRGIARVFKIGRNPLTKWLGEKGGACPAHRANALVAPQPRDNLELDEVWSLVRRKKTRAWVWIALSFQSRQVVAMVVGDRSSAKTCPKLWERVPEPYRKLTTYTNFWKVYQATVAAEQHQACAKGSGLTGHMPHMTNAVERFNLQPLLCDTLQNRRPDTLNNLEGTTTSDWSGGLERTSLYPQMAG